ncbi:MAG: hypothetical protein M1813_004834 [Trichoglossum hirsutum]|nr:MAG: hypothetical protein M1813_004834 [Trichoglossum hirsutum]
MATCKVNQPGFLLQRNIIGLHKPASVDFGRTSAALGRPDWDDGRQKAGGCVLPKVVKAVLSLQGNPDDEAGLRVLRPSITTGSASLEAGRLAVHKYAPVVCLDFTFDTAKIFERFASARAWQVWQRDGTMVIGSIFDYLNLPGIMSSIDVEFAIYRHHHHNLSGKSRLGWLRNMFYSLIQQLVRQDPVWYAIIASARPDKNWRLISYPYITKGTDAGGETTGFLHLDLNTSKFVQDGGGGNLLSSSMSLDNEESDGCTVVVPGFHRYIKEWYARRLGRGEDPAGFTTNCSTSYRAEDRRDWGNRSQPRARPSVLGSHDLKSSMAPPLSPITGAGH